jgi:adenylosuccinate synthase
MRTRAQAVIGAGYGDEGKGLMTDALAAAGGKDTLVVRFNGGAQAGHTVRTPDGRRHVFHHIGSGSLAGAATFLSRFFAVNPVFFGTEMAELAALGATPKVFIDPDAPVTTPYDMMINQFVERSRGMARHGSCGVGFGETVERHLSPRWRLSMRDLVDRRAVAAQLRQIRTSWLPQRLQQLGAWPLEPAEADIVASDAILEHWLDDVEAMSKSATLRDVTAIAAASHVVFEGAQGLLLDQDRGAFPHVTRSNTGLRNVLTLAAEAGIAAIDALYVTRAYATRHGAGPLAHECDGPPHAGIRDDTNVANPWQGRLRFGTLDVDVLGRAIRTDLADAGGTPVAVTHRLAVTCLDQVGAETRFVLRGDVHKGTPEALASTARAAAEAPDVAMSYGPDREQIRMCNLQ